MNEFELLRGLRTGVPAATPDRLSAGRERLLAAIVDGHVGPPAAARRPHPPRRPLIRLAIPGAAAATALAAAAWLYAAPTPAPHHAPAQVNASLTDQVLRSAAQKAASRPGTQPRPRQWIYTRVVSSGLGSARSSSVSWLRFDGRQEAYTENGRLVLHTTPVPPAHTGDPLTRFVHSSTVGTAYRALVSLPSQPSRLLQTVAREVSPSSIEGSGWDPARGHSARAQLEFGVLADLLWNGAQAAPAQAEANVFHAMVQIPGVKAQRGATDALGRPAIALSIGGVEQQLLLDPRTYQVIGERTLSDGNWPAPARGGRSTVPRGRVVQSLAWARIEFVGRPGQR